MLLKDGGHSDAEEGPLVVQKIIGIHFVWSETGEIVCTVDPTLGEQRTDVFMDFAKEPDDLDEIFFCDGFDNGAEEILEAIVRFCLEQDFCT